MHKILILITLTLSTFVISAEFEGNWQVKSQHCRVNGFPTKCLTIRNTIKIIHNLTQKSLVFDSFNQNGIKVEHKILGKTQNYDPHQGMSFLSVTKQGHSFIWIYRLDKDNLNILRNYLMREKSTNHFELKIVKNLMFKKEKSSYKIQEILKLEKLDH